MARPATGSIVEDPRAKVRTFALRFRANGERQYQRLGTEAEGWTRPLAQKELEKVLAEVKLGIWEPPAPPTAPEPQTDRGFHRFATDWLAAGEPAWRPKTYAYYKWQLTDHLLPFFRDHQLAQITVAEVDRYRAAKVRESAKLKAAQEEWRERVAQAKTTKERRELSRERPPRPLSAGTINRTLVTLAQILEVAVEYELIQRNPATGRRRRLKASKPRPVWLDRAEHIGALLDAAAELDREAPANRKHVERRALLSVLVFAGPRIGELLELQWRDVDLSAGKITVRESKTDAGTMRTIDTLPALQDTLTDLKARRNPSSPRDRVFPTTSGGRQSESNIRQRVIASAVKRANTRLEEAGEVPLPEGIGPHKLRHTYASVLVALGTDPGAAMDQLGHTDAKFTLSVYRHGMRRDPASKKALRELVGLAEDGGVWAANGQQSASQPGRSADLDESGHEKTPR